MPGIRDELDAFLRGETDLDGLLASIDHALMQDPAGVSVFLARVHGLYDKGRLPPQLLSVFEHQVATARQRFGVPEPIAGGPMADAAGDDAFAPGAMRPGGPRARAPDPSAVSGSRTGGYSQPQSQGSGALSSGYSTGNLVYPPQPGEPVVGQVLKERFELVELLGRGGMSVVFKAKDRRKEEALDRNPYVALKLLNASFKRNPHSLQTLQREARRAQNLNHPNVINIYDFDKDEHGNYFIAMELLSGSPLDKVIRELRATGGMEPARVYTLVERMGLALAAAHRQKPPIVHSDFKPSNVFLAANDDVKVFDFGIARAARPAGGAPGEVTNFDAGVLGALTPVYASLEMLASLDPDPRDDIYALAIVTYELFTGRRPFGRKTTAAEAVASGVRPPRVKCLSTRQWKGLQRALAFERERRTRTVEQFLDDLRPRQSHVPWYVAAGTLAAGALAWLLLAEGPPKERGEREILAEVATAPPQRLAALAAEAQEQPADVRKRIDAQVAERFLRSILGGDASEAIGARELIDALPEPTRQAVYAGISERMAAELAKADADGVGALMEAVGALPESYRRDVYLRARDRLLAWFKDDIRRRFDPAEDRYDYPGAHASLERAAVLYPDSIAVDEARARLDAERDRATAALDARLARLAAAGRLLPDDTADSVPAALERLLQIAPERHPAARASLAPAYLERAGAARRQGDLVEARAYVQTGVRLFPNDSGLQAEEDALARLSAEHLAQQAVADLRARIRDGLPQIAGPQDYARIADDLAELARRSPGDPLLSQAEERLAGALDRTLSPLLAAGSWDAGGARIGEYAALLSPARLADARNRLSAAQAEAERQARAEAERRAQAEAVAQRRTRDEEARRAQAEAERQARAEADRQAQAEAERQAKAEAERQAQEEARRRAQAQTDRLAGEEAARRARDAEERQGREATEYASALAYWNLIKDTGNVAAVRAFIDRFQDPVLLPLAEQRLAELEAADRAPAPAEPAAGVASGTSSAGAGLSEREHQEALRRAAEVPSQLIQQALKDLGYHDGPADGKMGPATERSIRAFQRARGSSQTGTLSNGQIVALVRTAAEAGHSGSQNTLAMMAAEGVGVAQSPETAVRWFRAAADQGNPYAAFNLGVLYREGRGVDASAEQARRYFEKARAGGHPEAAAALAELAAGAPAQAPRAGAVRTPATELPAHLIQQALEDVGFYSGRVDGLVGPGTRQAIRAYQAAQGEAQTGELSGEQTVALIRQAAASGHPKSENTLGMMAAEGVGVPQDARDAFRWFKSAADKGDAYGAYNLAILYRDGRGVASSVADARKYFALAVSGGHPQAAQALRELDD